MTDGDDIRPDLDSIQAERGEIVSPLRLVADPAATGTGLILFPRADSLPAVWVSGAALGEIGLAIGPRRTLTAAVILLGAL